MRTDCVSCLFLFEFLNNRFKILRKYPSGITSTSWITPEQRLPVSFRITKYWEIRTKHILKNREVVGFMKHTLLPVTDSIPFPGFAVKMEVCLGVLNSPFFVAVMVSPYSWINKRVVSASPCRELSGREFLRPSGLIYLSGWSECKTTYA